MGKRYFNLHSTAFVKEPMSNAHIAEPCSHGRVIMVYAGVLNINHAATYMELNNINTSRGPSRVCRRKIYTALHSCDIDATQSCVLAGEQAL